jgi:hypothetical protein
MDPKISFYLEGRRRALKVSAIRVRRRKVTAGGWGKVHKEEIINWHNRIY